MKLKKDRNITSVDLKLSVRRKLASLLMAVHIYTKVMSIKNRMLSMKIFKNEREAMGLLIDCDAFPPFCLVTILILLTNGDISVKI